MATTYEVAVGELYRARLDVFVAERKRLATELKAAGDKAGAARFAKLGRPPISAWAVNQLWWQERPAFEELLGVAGRLRAGERTAMVAHRELLARLRARAAALLGDAGHAATEATLRRVTATLSAIAAAGTFDPDPAGALATDRDPPGFDAVGFDVALAASARASTSALAQPDMPAGEADVPAGEAEALAQRRIEQERERAAAERAAAERAAAERAAAERAAAERAAAERSRFEAAERARRLAERERLDGELRSMKLKADARRRDIERLRRELSGAEAELLAAQATIDELEARKAELDSKS